MAHYSPPGARLAPPVELQIDLVRAIVRLAGACTSAEVQEGLERAASALPNRAILVVYRSNRKADDSGDYQVLARAGGPIGVPSRVPWGSWGPADATRQDAPTDLAQSGPHPFGPCRQVRIGGPASRAPGEGIGLALLLGPMSLDPPDQEIVEVLAEAAAAGIHRAAQLADLALRSYRDPLTGVLNRKALEEVLVREMKRASRPNNIKQTSLLTVDLDGFKQINDTHGHHAGDLILRAVAEAMKEVLRVEDVVARYGGDEFVLLLPETDIQGALRVGNKVRDRISRLRVQSGGHSLGILASIGAATDPGESATFDHAPTDTEKRALARRFANRIRRLMSSSDTALYQAKEAGRDAVRHSDPGPSASTDDSEERC